MRFIPEALKEWGLAYPDVPPGDEVVLWMKLEACSNCGAEPGKDGEFGAIDPEYVTSDGLLMGKQLCAECVAA